ncbi:MAG: HD domain-containing protein [Halanaerobium sp.]|nr:HD domain-containing protein [Halanaerobium sp.]
MKESNEEGSVYAAKSWYFIQEDAGRAEGPVFAKIEEAVRKGLSCSAHDLEHVNRVVKTCGLLAQGQREVDRVVLLAAALLHDIARVREDEDKTGNIDHAVLGAELARGILMDSGFPAAKIGHVQECIRAHRFRSGHHPATIEAKILFDADKLDALGAVGIARSFILAGQFGEPLYLDINIASYQQVNVTENGRVKDIQLHAPNIEYEVKFKKIPARLYTEEARKLAEERLEYMDEFYARLAEEITGDRRGLING